MESTTEPDIYHLPSDLVIVHQLVVEEGLVVQISTPQKSYSSLIDKYSLWISTETQLYPGMSNDINI